MADPTEATYVDVSNLPELKDVCDGAVERILSRAPRAIDAPAPGSGGSLTPASDPKPQADADDVQGDGDSEASQIQAPWTGSHVVGDAKLVLGYLSAFVLLGVSAWSYLSPLPFSEKKLVNAAAVGVYVVAAALQQLFTWLQHDALFVARRRASQHGIILTERLTISAVTLPAPTLLPAPQEGAKPVCVPPVYSLRVRYARTSNGGKTLLKQAEQPFTLGHLGEWFAADGEFLEHVFEQRLRGALAKMID